MYPQTLTKCIMEKIDLAMNPPAGVDIIDANDFKV